MTKTEARAVLPFAALIGERLRERGLGLREFCRSVELDPSFFSKVLAGKRSPPAEEAVLRRIAAALELDAPALIVAAGRIPGEWERIWADEALLASVHRLVTGRGSEAPPIKVTGKGIAAARLARTVWERTVAAREGALRTRPAAVPKILGEELL